MILLTLSETVMIFT